MISYSEKVISLYNEFRNEIIEEDKLVDNLEPLFVEIEKYWNESVELDIAVDELHDWDEACEILFGLIHQLTLFYKRGNLLHRTPINRIRNMDTTIEDYYKQLDKVSKLEKEYNILN